MRLDRLDHLVLTVADIEATSDRNLIEIARQIHEE